MSLVLWTIGHSTRPIDDFIGLLLAPGIQLLADVRTIPSFTKRFLHRVSVKQEFSIDTCRRWEAGGTVGRIL